MCPGSFTDPPSPPPRPTGLAEPSRVRASASESLLTRVLDDLPVAVGCSRLTPEVPIVYLNARFVETFGYTLDDIPTVDAWVTAALDPMMDREAWRSLAERAGAKRTAEELRVRCRDGTLRDVRIDVAAVEDLRVVSFVDITEQKGMEQTLLSAQEGLRESEERYRQLAECLTDVVWLLDVQTLRFTYISPSVERQVGLTQEEAVLRGIDGLTPESQARAQEAVARALEMVSRGDPVAFQTLEVDQYHKDGHLVPSEVTVRALLDADGTPRRALGVTRDISARRAAELRLAERERQLHEAHRLEAVGILAGGIAHHYNNILTSILGTTELLLTDPHLLGTPAVHDLEVIKSQAERAAEITWKLLTLAERQFVRQQSLCLADAVLAAAPLLHEVLGQGVELALKVDATAAQVNVDPSHLELLLEYLTSNARDAMPSGGTFTLATAPVELRPDRAETLGVPAGPYIELSAADTGVGMSPETLAHLFDPFFTTKDVGKGFGLGIPVVRGIVRMSNGGIAVESVPGQGTTVRIYLPRAG